MKVLVHQQLYKEILWSFGLEKLFSLRWSFLHDFSLIWFIFVIVTLKIVLPNHTWNIIISSKPCFVIIKIKINQTFLTWIGGSKSNYSPILYLVMKSHSKLVYLEFKLEKKKPYNINLVFGGSRLQSIRGATITMPP